MARNAERKILSFSTTLRNPRRIGEFLVVIAKFENELLTHDTIMKIVKGVLNHRLYLPNSVKNNRGLKDLFENASYVFSDNELNHIIEISPQNHKERGFEHGWESRFDTWYKLMSEFGFCYYAKEQPILISESAKTLIDIYFDKDSQSFRDDYDESAISGIFANALAKYEVGNPYKKNLNHNVPFRLLLRLLQKLKLANFSPLNIKEIPILLCWHDDNVDELFAYICELRDEIFNLTSTKFGYSDEFIYEKCLLLLDSENTNRFKISQITGEAVDEYVRKMRITGLISLRGGGRFIDINSNELEKAQYIINLQSSFIGDYLDDSDTNRLAFFNYMATIDPFLVTASEASVGDDIKIAKLKSIANSYDVSTIENELLIACNKQKTSNDELFRRLDKPLRFEFLTAIYLAQSFKNLSVIPNYKSDDEGVPVFTASGGKADIVAYDTRAESYVEVSLIRDRSQSTNEMIPISRHLESFIKNSTDEKERFSIFIAPNIHDDAKEYAIFVKHRKQLNIPYYAIGDFIEKVKSSEVLLDLNDQTLLV